jgi:hypothetical protein
MHSGGPKRDQEIAPAVGGPDQRTPSHRVVVLVCAPATDRTGRDIRYPRRQLGIALSRLAIAVITAIRFWPAAPAWSATSNYSMVPSVAIGRDIPVAHSGGGEAGDAVSNWVTAGDAMNTLAGKDISVITPAPEMVMLHPGRGHQA